MASDFWDQVGTGSKTINWDDVGLPDQPTFGSGTAERMAQYQGLSPEEASSKYVSGQKQSLSDISGALTETDPAKRIASLKSALRPAYHALTETDPAKRLSSLKSVISHYYENPDELATDVALTLPIPEAAAAKVVRGMDESMIAAKTASLPERIAKLPERPEVPVSEAERTADIKAKAGAGIQAAKDSGAVVPVSEAQDLLKSIKADTKSEYNPLTHTGMKGFFYKFADMLPQEDEAMKAGKAAAKAQMARMAPMARASVEAKLAELPPLPDESVVTVKQLHDVRQSLDEAQSHAYKNDLGGESKAASKAKEALDDFIVNKMGQGEWPQDMKDYALASTAEDFKNITNRALYRRTQLSAGQKAAAIHTEIRNWARPTYKGPNARMRMVSKISPEAAKQIEAIATAKTPNSTLLRILGTAAPTGVMPVALDEIAGHLFTGLLGIHVSPLLLMGGGAIAKGLAGARAERGIEEIIKTLNDASSIGPRVTNLQKTVGPGNFEKLMSRPRTAQAIRNWANATGDRKRIATIALTAAIAKEVNRPDLQGRIKQEIDNIDPDRSTTVPEQMAGIQP